MPYISNFDRCQSTVFSIDDFIDANNPIRVIDAFANSLDLDALGFIIPPVNLRGQQPYKRSDLLKLYIYGYMNGFRSCRRLATEASRNVELMWLLNNVTPSKTCISDFLRDNRDAIDNVFKLYISFLKFADFVDCKSVVIDGSKIRAQNSRNKYYSLKKIDSTISYFNSQIDSYLDSIQSENDSIPDSDTVIVLKDKIEHYKQKIEEFNNLKTYMKDNELKQITLTDPESRMMTSHGKSDICYNLQTSVDSKHSLIVACDVVSDLNDTNQLENMANKTVQNLSTVPEASTADMGYFNAEQIHNVEQLGTNVFVKRPKTKNSTDNSSFSIDKFTFDKDKNIYICPAGKELHFNRNLRKKKNKNDESSSIVGFEYICSECSNCPYRKDCTTSSNRSITRNFYQDTLDKVQERFEKNPQMYTLRKCVVEHPFGTIKRSLGYTYFLCKGLKAVRTEAALICLAYNFKRMVNISPIDDIIRKIGEFFSLLTCFFYSFHFILQKTYKFSKNL